ncbi:hypothetical protein HLRTI_000622 [Halorhabdus tiamatea SARL4B]|uniref:Uncharacterized protein n=1 Tax=Halorhabdus tiamatea SARL4B TaxID=1033806 RepID=S6CU51_9EURY|nr:hypothetical protein HLRTI_000622 [Halorhabdus tiamatea SARL4B]CCQ34174.1 hypothetical protein HTIA_2060 [Halorhabdus tiamatea SARL4B]
MRSKMKLIAGVAALATVAFAAVKLRGGDSTPEEPGPE